MNLAQVKEKLEAQGWAFCINAVNCKTFDDLDVDTHWFKSPRMNVSAFYNPEYDNTEEFFLAQEKAHVKMQIGNILDDLFLIEKARFLASLKRQIDAGEEIVIKQQICIEVEL